MSKKQEKAAVDLINWSVLSRLLTGKKQNIRPNVIPEKYRVQVENLKARNLFFIIYHNLGEKE